jgi:hypothetical protein
MLADSSASVGLYFGLGIFAYVLYALAFAGIFKKADQPIWAAFIPIVNLYFVLKVVGRPGWWIILYFIPCIGLIIGLVVLWDLAKSFGHGVGVFILLIIFSFLTLLYLGFGQSQYRGPAAAQL